MENIQQIRYRYFTEAEQAELRGLIASGAVTAKRHPKYDLYLYSYTRDYVRTPNEARWKNDLLNQCRGLIATGDGAIVVRPFPKFFNYEEIDAYYEPGYVENLVKSKHLYPQIWEKVDGSLGILYFPPDGSAPELCTRNSWDSDQAIEGTRILRRKYWRALEQLDRSKTYLFEIIYPENRLIIDYGSREDVVLLAVRDTASGYEYPINDPRFNPGYSDNPEFNKGFPIPHRYMNVSDWHNCREFIDPENKEGFVVRFIDSALEPTPAFRVKMKFKEYFEMNFLKGKLTRQNILKLVTSDQGKLREMFDRLREAQAEEMEIIARNYVKEFEAYRDKLAADAIAAYKSPEEFPSKAEWAAYVKASGSIAPVLFKLKPGASVKSLMDDPTMQKILWKIVWQDLSEQKEEQK